MVEMKVVFGEGSIEVSGHKVAYFHGRLYIDDKEIGIDNPIIEEVIFGLINIKKYNEE